MEYYCIRAFKSEFSDEFFAVSNIISKEDYEKLNFEEKANFLEINNEEFDKEDFLDRNFPGLTGRI